MMIREMLGLPVGAMSVSHPIYRTISQGRYRKLPNAMKYTNKEFIAKYLSSWSPGKAFNWDSMMWVTYKRKYNTCITKRPNGASTVWFFKGTKTHPFRANKTYPKYVVAVKWRNEYIIVNGLLGEFKLI